MFPIYSALLAFSPLILAVEDCIKSAREDRCSEIFQDIELCNEESYRPQLMDCLVTCGKCSAFSCNNPQPDAFFNCTALASQCNSTVWEHFMKEKCPSFLQEKCPSTCGKCDIKNANLCKDASDSVMCSTMVQFCNSLDFYDQMSEQCASTCNRCPNPGDSVSKTCKDLAHDCRSRISLCDHPKYDGLMRRACAKTCNKCGTCYDATDRCQQWAARGFCNNYEYTHNLRMKLCAKTCKLC